jgi:hypothetical protein
MTSLRGAPLANSLREPDGGDIPMKLSVQSPILAIVLSTGLWACRTEEPPVAAPTEPAAEAPAKQAPVVEAPKPEEPTVSAKKSEGPKVTIEHPAQPEIDRDAKLTVKRLVIAPGVKNREPLEPRSIFSTSDDRIYAFVEIGNAERAPSEIFVSFAREGEAERGRIPLKVGASPRWRTWAYTRQVDAPGAWRAVVRDARGREIARTDFEVVVETAAVKKLGEPHI